MSSPSVNNNTRQVRWSAELPASIALFAGIHEKQVAAIMAAAYSRKVDANQWLYQEGDKADRFFLLGAGRVKLYKISKKGPKELLPCPPPVHAFAFAPILLP